MVGSEWELQKAVYGKLTASTSLMSQISGVYDHVPQGTAFPYVALEEIHSEDSSNLAERITRVRLAIGVYTRERGSKTALAIMDEIKVLLHQAVLTVSGYSFYSCYFAGSELQQLPDGLTYKGKMLFIAYLEG
jgi:hypothetical protein